MLSGVAVVAGPDHTCALTNAGVVACWGANTHGQLGDGTLVSSVYPAIATELAGAVELAVGYAHTCARLADGTVRCVGSFTRGQLGDGRIVGPAAPAPAAILCE